MAPQQAKVARWCMSMAEFDFFIKHRKGERNVVPDVLSRHPVEENIPEDNVIIPPEDSVVAFLIIATSVDLPLPQPTLSRYRFKENQMCKGASKLHIQARPRLYKLVNIKKAYPQTANLKTLKILNL